MATRVMEAIFRDGAFRPVQEIAPHFVEGQHVRLVIEVEEADVLDLATGVYDGLSNKEVRQIEQVAFSRREFFGRELP